VAETAYICAQGKLKVDVALLDATDTIWEGTGDSPKELELVKRFHNLPNGFVISDLKGVRRKANQLKAVVNPGLPLTDAEKDEIRALGLKLYEYEEVDKIESDIPCGISWQGDGKLMFMRRELADGKELLVVGNIESDDVVTGTLTFDGKDYEIELASGEMAFFGGGFDKYRTPIKDTEKLMLPDTAEVTFGKPNLLPLVRWENEKGKGITLQNPETNVSWVVASGWVAPQLETIPAEPTMNPAFRFVTDKALDGLELMLPEDMMAYVTAARVDGKELTYKSAMIFDDAYRSYGFSVGIGEHSIELSLSDFVQSNCLPYLRGEFDAKVDISGEYITNGGKYITEFAMVSLTERSKTLKTGLSWTEQGQPMYSGTADYKFTVELPENIKNPTVVIPNMHDPVKVYVDGKLVKNIPYAPYRAELGVEAGKHEIVLSVCNTLGNMLDAFRMPSGLLTKPYITSGM